MGQHRLNKAQCTGVPTFHVRSDAQCATQKQELVSTALCTDCLVLPRRSAHVLTTGQEQAVVPIAIDSGAHQHGHSSEFSFIISGCSSRLHIDSPADGEVGKWEICTDYYAAELAVEALGNRRTPSEHIAQRRERPALVRGTPSHQETLVGQGTCRKPIGAILTHLKTHSVPL